MIYTVFDLETTGLVQGQCAVVQFAFIQLNEAYMPIRANSFYIDPPEGRFRWDEEAERIHGLSREFLHENAIPYDEALCKMYAALQYGALVTYNGNSFDIPFASKFLDANGLPFLQIHESYDVMRMWQDISGHRCKLTQLPAEAGIDKRHIETCTGLLFKGCNVRPHDAAYDTTATMFGFQRCMQRQRLAQKEDQKAAVDRMHVNF